MNAELSFYALTLGLLDFKIIKYYSMPLYHMKISYLTWASGATLQRVFVFWSVFSLRSSQAVWGNRGIIPDVPNYIPSIYSFVYFLPLVLSRVIYISRIFSRYFLMKIIITYYFPTHSLNQL